MRVLYLAHDLDDNAIWRRAEMLRRGGAEVILAGFRRGEGVLPGPAKVLGRTQNGRMTDRAFAVLRAVAGRLADNRRAFLFINLLENLGVAADHQFDQLMFARPSTGERRHLAAVFEHRDAVADFEHVFEKVRDKNDRLALTFERGDKFKQPPRFGRPVSP